MKYCPAVATHDSLPVSDNFIGDIRKSIDTNEFWIWDSQSSSGSLGDWRLLGQGLGTTVDHATLLNLGFNDSGHTGFLRETNSVKDRVTTATLGGLSPALHDRYILTDGANEKKIAECTNATGPVWAYTLPEEGWFLWVDAEDKFYHFDGSDWQLGMDSSGSGDMLKATYDADDDDIVDKAASVDDGVNSSSAADIKDAVDKKHSNSLDHAQGTDQSLDSGGANEVTAADAADAVAKKHTQNTDDKTVVLKPISETDSLDTGDGVMYFVAPVDLNGYNLYGVGAHVFTVSSSGLPNIQINNSRNGDMLSTSITIDENEKDSKDAAAPAVIDMDNDDIQTGDEIRIDVDTKGTGTKGLEIRLTFRKP